MTHFDGHRESTSPNESCIFPCFEWDLTERCVSCFTFVVLGFWGVIMPKTCTVLPCQSKKHSSFEPLVCCDLFVCLVNYGPSGGGVGTLWGCARTLTLNALVACAGAPVAEEPARLRRLQGMPPGRVTPRPTGGDMFTSSPAAVFASAASLACLPACTNHSL